LCVQDEFLQAAGPAGVFVRVKQESRFQKDAAVRFAIVDSDAPSEVLLSELLSDGPVDSEPQAPDDGSQSWIDRLTPEELGALDAFERRILLDELRWRVGRQLQLERRVIEAETLVMIAITTRSEPSRRERVDRGVLGPDVTSALAGSTGPILASSIARAAGDVASRRRQVLLRLRDAIERDDKDEALCLAAELVGVAPR
jgi:hypothetical protein